MFKVFQRIKMSQKLIENISVCSIFSFLFLFLMSFSVLPNYYGNIIRLIRRKAFIPV